MIHDHAHGGFDLHITSLESFLIFCAILRGEDLTDESKLREMAARLTPATKALADAETADRKSQPST